MNWNNIFGDKLIVVDIQPAHEEFITFSLPKFVQVLSEYDGKVLYFFNGTDLGYNSEEEVTEWLTNIFINDIASTDEEVEQFIYRLNTINFIEKDYGFIRDLMDNGYEDDAYTILKFMIDKGYHSSYDLTDGDYEELDIDEELKENIQDSSYRANLPMFELKVLDNWNNSTLVGGGRTECLLEIEILLNALNINYKKYNGFIY